MHRQGAAAGMLDQRFVLGSPKRGVQDEPVVPMRPLSAWPWTGQNRMVDAGAEGGDAMPFCLDRSIQNDYHGHIDAKEVVCQPQA